MTALQGQLAKYDALVSSVMMSNYGYWEVTFSVAPAVAMTITVCQTGISTEAAVDLAAQVLASQTGQKVRGA
jgi:hypothetical protein